jgi:hypothetical protein
MFAEFITTPNTKHLLTPKALPWFPKVETLDMPPKRAFGGEAVAMGAACPTAPKKAFTIRPACPTEPKEAWCTRSEWVSEEILAREPRKVGYTATYLLPVCWPGIEDDACRSASQ